MELLHTATFHAPFGHGLEATKDALVGEGFSVIAQVDLRASLAADFDVDVAPYALFGAHTPDVTAAAVAADASAALSVLYWVTVRSAGDDTTVATYNPAAQAAGADTGPQLQGLVDAAADRLREAMTALDQR